MIFDLRRGQGDVVMMWVMAGLLGFATLMVSIAGLALVNDGEGAAVLLIAIALFMGAMTWLVCDEALSRAGTRVALDGAGGLHLKLPGRRSYVGQAPVSAVLPLATVRGIETRLEAFRALGNTVIQRAYVLILADGGRLALGADRRMMAPFFGEAAAAIAQRTNLPIADRGAVDGAPGFAMIWGASVPDWQAPSLPQAASEKRVRDEQTAWRVVAIVVGAAMLIGALARALG